ncbi:MAG: DUF669 domain-containing protein [Acidobacteria bacterium]|nr:DUF669 domain-containing protein [Acidobacteriota bacterium]
MNDFGTATAPVQMEDLEKLDTRFQQLPDTPGMEIPDGAYSVIVEEVRLDRTRTTGNPRVNWVLRIQQPEPAGRVLFKHRVITENTLSFLKEDLLACGVKLQKLSELPSRLREMAGLTLDVVKRTKDGRYNVYFARPRAEEVALDDSLPF